MRVLVPCLLLLVTVLGTGNAFAGAAAGPPGPPSPPPVLYSFHGSLTGANPPPPPGVAVASVPPPTRQDSFRVPVGVSHLFFATGEPRSGNGVESVRVLAPDGHVVFDSGIYSHEQGPLVGGGSGGGGLTGSGPIVPGIYKVQWYVTGVALDCYLTISA